MTYLSICVLNALFSFVATIGNLLVIRAPWKASSVTSTLKMFLSLAFCDLEVGLFSQPFLAALYGATVTEAASGNYDFDGYCPVISFTSHGANVFSGWSFVFHDCRYSGGPAGARYTKSIVSIELRHKEHNNDPYSLHNNTIDFTQ